MKETRSRYRLWLAGLVVAGLALGLSACGGGGSDSVASPAANETFGIAVDPYVSGAYFQELDGNGDLLQETPAPSDLNGRFVFTRPLTPGSTVVMKVGSLALHNGATYQGMLKRKIVRADNGTLVVSPLTTLLAADLSEQQVLGILASAGISGLTAADLDDDPMARAAGGSDLRLLQANMAVNSFIEKVMDEARGEPGFDHRAFNARLGSIDNAENALLLATLTEAMGDCLDSSRLSGRTIDEVIRQAAEVNQALCALIRENRGTDMGTLAQRIRDAVQQELHPAPEPTPTVDGQALYDTNCAGCHKLGDYDASGGLDLAGKTAQIAGKLQGGHMGKTLTADQLTALAAWAAGIESPAPDPLPAPADGAALFANDCSGCHNHTGSGGVYDLSGDGPRVAEKFTADNAGHQNKTFTAEQIQALADYLDTFAPAPLPAPDPAPVDGPALFADHCAGCHSLSGTGGTFDLAGDGSLVQVKFTAGQAGHRGLTFSAAQIEALADHVDGVSPAPAPEPDPTPVPVDGTALYGSECAGCHGSLGTSNVQERSASGIQAAIAGNLGNMGFLSLSAEQLQALAAALAEAPQPEPQPVDGAAIYANRCAGCHKLGAVDPAGGPDLAAAGDAVIAKLQGGHQGISLNTAELNALADYVDTVPLPEPPPVPEPVDGATIYTGSCAGCHKLGDVDTSGNIDLAASGDAVFAKLQGGHQGLALTLEELTALADYVDTFAPPVDPGPDYSDCTVCHGQPPTGAAAGAHAAHTALPDVGGNCGVCHQGASHNGALELAFTATWSAKSGTATANLDGTCSNISCHGGVKTPAWSTGSIAVDSQCTKCHVAGTSQYNGNSSGRHSKHRNAGIGCTSCHDTGKLAAGHFSSLDTSVMEGPAANTLLNSLNYNGSTCSLSCHGENHNNDRW